MNWIKDNWFKLVITIAIICAIGLGSYYVFTLNNQTAQKVKSDLEMQHAVDLKTKEEEIKKLQTQIEEITKEKNNETKSPTPTTNQSISSKNDPAVLIEKCKAQAKAYADKIAKRDYLLAFERAQEAGDTESAQFYLEASFEPKHPANYDSNYSSEYTKCLDS